MNTRKPFHLSLALILLLLPSRVLWASSEVEPGDHVSVTIYNGFTTQETLFGAKIDLQANPPPEGFVFLRWMPISGGGYIESHSPNTFFNVPNRATRVAAVYGKIESWFPPGDENGNVGLLIPKLSSGRTARFEHRVRVTLDVGEAEDELQMKDVWDKVSVLIDWFPEADGVSVWHSNELVTYWDRANRGTQIQRNQSMPKRLFGEKSPGVYEGSVWYEANFTSADLSGTSGSRGPRSGQKGSNSKVPPTTSTAAELVVSGKSFAEKVGFSNGRLVTAEMILHERGTINSPGKAIPRSADSSKVYEVVTLENADFDEQTGWAPNSMASANEGSRQDGATPAVDVARDDDFVKIHLKFPADKIQGSVELAMEKPGQGERMNAEHLRFYNSQGQRIPLAALKIPDLQKPEGPLAPMLDTGGLDLFVEIGDLGILTRLPSEANSQRFRYLDLILRLNIAGKSVELKARVCRGGYWRNQRNGNTGTIAFYDGKGRYLDPNGSWQVDVGQSVHGPYPIQSGRPGEHDHTASDLGPTPPGWYGIYERLDISPDWRYSDRTRRWSRPQRDHNYDFPNGRQLRPPLKDGVGQYWQQGSYSQWGTPGNRDRVTHRGASTPPSIQFKFQLVEAYEFTPRSLLQIHPDGWSDGTAGCVGLQTYNDSCRIFFLLRHYSGTMLHVEAQ